MLVLPVDDEVGEEEDKQKKQEEEPPPTDDVRTEHQSFPRRKADEAVGDGETFDDLTIIARLIVRANKDVMRSDGKPRRDIRTFRFYEKRLIADVSFARLRRERDDLEFIVVKAGERVGGREFDDHVTSACTFARQYLKRKLCGCVGVDLHTEVRDSAPHTFAERLDMEIMFPVGNVLVDDGGARAFAAVVGPRGRLFVKDIAVALYGFRRRPFQNDVRIGIPH